MCVCVCEYIHASLNFRCGEWLKGEGVMCVCINMSVVCEYIHGGPQKILSVNAPSRNFEMYMYM